MFNIHSFYLILFLMQNMQAAIEPKINYFQNNNKLSLKLMFPIIRNCFISKGGNIVLSGNWSNDDIRPLESTFLMTSLYLVGSHATDIFERHKRLKNSFILTEAIMKVKKYPAVTSVLAVSSDADLISTLYLLRNSTLWNHQGFFVIVATNRCESAGQFLQTVWSFNILRAVLLCQNANNEIQLYTFNPYNSLAPNFWNRSSRADVRDNHQWTLFIKSINTKDEFLDPSVCQNLDFDKTTNLKGYNIRIGVHCLKDILRCDLTKSGFNKFSRIDGEIQRAVWTSLNVTATFKYYSNLGFIDDVGRPQGSLQDITSGVIDFEINRRLQRDFWKLQTYPHEMTDICIATAPLDMSPLQKIFYNVSLTSALVMLASYLALMLVLKYVLRSGTAATTGLELVRMLVGTSTIHQPHTSSQKIFFLNAMLLIALVSSYFQTQLNAYYVAPNSVASVNSRDDLIKSGLEVYGPVSLKQFIVHLDLQKRYRMAELSECVERVTNGEKIACVQECSRMRYSLNEGSYLHVAKGRLRELFLVFMMREDWPLRARLKKILRRIGGAGIIVNLRTREKRNFLKNEGNHLGSIAGTMTLEQLGFFFKIMGFLFGFATLVFLIEILLHKIIKLKNRLY